MKRKMKSMLSLLLSIAILASVIFVVPVQASSDYIMYLKEETLSATNKVYKMNLYVKGYSDMTGASLVLAFDSSNISLIEAWSYNDDGTIVTELDENTDAFESVFTNKGKQPFSINEITFVALDEKTTGIEIVAYNDKGYDLSAEPTLLLSMYYQVKDTDALNKASFRVLTTDEELNKVVAGTNVAGASIASKSEKKAYYAKHSQNTVANADALDFQGLEYTNSTKDALQKVTITPAAGSTGVVPTTTEGDKNIQFTPDTVGLTGSDYANADKLTYNWEIVGNPDADDISISDGKLTIKPAAAEHVDVTSGTKVTVKATAVENGVSTGVSGTYELTLSRVASAVDTISATGGDIIVPADGVDKAATKTFTAKDQYGLDMDENTLTWSVESAPEGIYVANGVVSVTNDAKTAVKDGAKTYTVKANGATAKFTVALADSKVAAVTATADDNVVEVPVTGNATEALSAKVIDQYGKDITDDATIEWSVSGAEGSGIKVEGDKLTVPASAKSVITDTTGKTVSVTATVTKLNDDDVTDVASNTVSVTVARAAATASSIVIKYGDTELGATDTIVIPLGDESNSKVYTAVTKDQYGREMEPDTSGNPHLSCSIGKTDDKVEITNTNPATVKVNKGAEVGNTVTLTATDSRITESGYKKEVVVSLVALDAQWPTDLAKDGTYGTKNADLVTLPNDGKPGAELGYKLGSDEIKYLTGTYEVVDGDTKQDAGDKTVTVKFIAASTGNGEYNSITLTHEYEVTIAPKSITGAGVEVVPATYNGTAQKNPTVTLRNIETGGAALVDGTNFDVEVVGDCINAGEYKVTVTGKGNYTGETTGTYIIKPAEISINSAVVDDKTYNGKTDDANVTGVTFKDVPEHGATVNYKVVSAVYESADVADSVPVDIEVELTGSNYKFAEGSDTYKATGKITKADAPSVKNYELTIYYKDDTDKTVDAADFGITEGEGGWKDVVLTSDFSGDVIASVTANSGGTLTLTPTASADAEATDEITVTINSKNYKATTAQITVTAVDISIPWPTAPTIKEAPVYGDTNANIISGFESRVTATTDKDIPGTITVKDADATPDAGTTAVTLVFTPENGYGFDGQTFEHSYDITAVKPATITVTPDDGQSKVYGEDDPDEFTYTVSGAKNGEEVMISGKLERELGDTVGTYGYSVADMTLQENGAFKPSNYTLEVASGVMFTIEPKPVGVSIVVDTEYVYDGNAKQPGKDDITVIYTDGESEVKIEDTDYKIDGYGENINAGKGTVKISASANGNYSFKTTSCEFDIDPCPVAIEWYLEEDQSGTDNEDGTFTFVYNGEVQYPAAKYTPLTEDEGCAISYGGELEPSVGGYTATATCEDSNYVAKEGTESCTFEIIAAEFTSAEDGKIESSLSGRTRVGQELTAVITMNGVDVTDDFNIVWYAVNEDSEDGTGIEIGDGSTLELTNDHKGMQVYYVATSKDENIVLKDELQTDPSDKITKRSSSGSIRRDEEEEIVVRVEDLNAAQRENFNNLLFTYGPYADIKLGFSDVAASAWYYDYVTDMANAGVINGYPDGTFRPEGDVTWGETLKLVMKAVGYPDIPAVDGHWASGYMATAIADLLISGEVNLDAAITREEVANLTAQALKLAPAGIEYPFEDNAPEAAVALYAAGIITGSLDNGQLLFRAESTITRAEMAAIIYRVYNAK